MKFKIVEEILKKILNQLEDGVFPQTAIEDLENIYMHAFINDMESKELESLARNLSKIEENLAKYQMDNYQSEFASNRILQKINLIKDRVNTVYVFKRVPNQGFIDTLHKEDFSSNNKDDFNFRQLTIALSESKDNSRLEYKAVKNFLLEGNMNYLHERYLKEDEMFDVDDDFEKDRNPKKAEGNLNKLINAVKKVTASSRKMDDNQLAKANRIRFVRAILTAILFCIGLKVSSGAIGRAKTALIGLLGVILIKDHNNKETNRLQTILINKIESLEQKIEYEDDPEKRKNLEVLKSDLEYQLKKVEKKLSEEGLNKERSKNFSRKAKNAIARGDINDDGDDDDYF